jgi:hypothetical protein
VSVGPFRLDMTYAIVLLGDQESYASSSVTTSLIQPSPKPCALLCLSTSQPAHLDSTIFMAPWRSGSYTHRMKRSQSSSPGRTQIISPRGNGVLTLVCILAMKEFQSMLLTLITLRQQSSSYSEISWANSNP